jgi:hypothetical protein
MRIKNTYSFSWRGQSFNLKRCKFTILWLTRYIPGDPDVTNLKIRGQTLFANPAEYKQQFEKRGIQVRFSEQSPLYE